VGAIDAGVALPFIGVTGGLLLCLPLPVLLQSLAIARGAPAPAPVPPLPAHRPDDGRPLIFIRAVSTPLGGSAPRRSTRSAVFFTFFPPQSETSQQFQYRPRAPPAGLKSPTRWLGFCGATAARPGGRATVPRLRRLPVRPCPPRALTPLRVGAQGCCRQSGSQYRGWRGAGSFGSGKRRRHACVGETLAPVELLPRSQGIAGL
jgi:hypothetical protein